MSRGGLTQEMTFKLLLKEREGNNPLRSEVKSFAGKGNSKDHKEKGSMTWNELGASVARAKGERDRQNDRRWDWWVKSGQALLGFVGWTRVDIKEQSSGILFFTSYKDTLTAVWRISGQLAIRWETMVSWRKTVTLVMVLSKQEIYFSIGRIHW